MKASLKLVDITPPIGSQMGGFGERDHGAEGIHDPLYAQIAVLDDGQNKVAYVVCDVIGLNGPLTERVREIVSTETDIRPENIMISATHTHSGPYIPRMGDTLTRKKDKSETGPNNIMDIEQFIEKIAYGIFWANLDLQEAKVGFGMGHVNNVGLNRNDPEAYYDFSVNVVKFETLDNKLMGMLVNHACHPTVVNSSNYLYTADYPGMVRKHLKTMFPEAVMLFCNGLAGSASTRFTRKGSGFEEADRLGLILAGEVIKVLPTIDTTTDVKVDGKMVPLSLTVKKFPSVEECLALVESNTAKLKELERTKADPRLIRRAYVTLQGAQRQYITVQNIDFTEKETYLQKIDFGVCAIIGVPGDVFGEIGRDIKLLSKEKPLITTGYTNDFVGYLLSNEGFEMDCYEKNSTLFNESTHQRIVEATKKLL